MKQNALKALNLPTKQPKLEPKGAVLALSLCLPAAVPRISPHQG